MISVSKKGCDLYSRATYNPGNTVFTVVCRFSLNVQEWIFSVEGFKPFGWYLTMIQFACYSLFGFTERRLRNEGRRRYYLVTQGYRFPTGEKLPSQSFNLPPYVV